tara:strand:+ start:583 stop:870 length:288 start_codon:yes stop_codon:yes gene_type:complete
MNYIFKRENRGASSDVYAILSKDTNEINGRLDLHFFSNGVIEGVVVYTSEIDTENELMLIEQIDSELVPQAKINDKNFTITFVKSSEVKVYGKEE